MRHNLAAIVATAVDYGVMVALVELAAFRPVGATAVGAFCGAVTNFTLGRFFTYRVNDAPVVGQTLRYALVSGAGLGLNTGGEFLFSTVLGLQYLVARVITSIVVSTGWNYPLQRFFVFSRRPPSTTAHPTA
jgi:putative flippase GtrA